MSRQREFLADASSVQFTRNPAGLAGALKKIGGLAEGSRLETAHADAASHMYFGNGMRPSFLHLLDTHPPLAERIRAIEPSFDGVFPHVDAPLEEGIPLKPFAPQQDKTAFRPVSPAARVPAPGAPFAAAVPVTSNSIIAQTGTPTTAHLEYAAGLRSEMPASLQAAARESMGAATLVYALLLSDESAAQAKQLSELAGVASSAICQETLRILPEVRQVSARAKLPLVDLALTGLRHMSRLQFHEFRQAVKALVESDGEIDLFE